MLTARFDGALLLANELHRKQVRKGTGTPYVAHLLSVAALVLEDGGSEDEAIAAILHDAVEDQGGETTLERIRRSFGDDVAAIVVACTDATTLPKPPWRERKERYVAHLLTAPAAALRVSLADKVHNARSILFDYREVGEALWDRFHGGKEGTLWYYRTLVERFSKLRPGPLASELTRVVSELERLAGEADRSG